ncbi:hypothetical protein ACMFMG_006064 [Clarireedia jacksonii]
MAPSRSPAEPIALVGMSCRLPGGVSNPSKLWDLLADGKSGLSEIPKSRFNVDAFYHPDPSKTGTISAKGGYFLKEDVRLFDNAFFGINNLETKYMDPQQRQLLEVVYECFESAGVTLEEVSGANIGCYVANFTTDFVSVQAKDPDLYHRYSATGFGPTILANRISHTFNLQGPSLILDTACSSSLYALHVACAALNAGECDSAIVAGANLVQSPEAYIAMTKAGVLSSTSVSHTFDSSADGYGRGEGVAALYLKRMGSLKSSDPVRSIIRGTAVNSNGHTPGITMPGKHGQEAVIRKAYAMAGLSLEDTTYIETHGTGTSIGDPIEVEAISKCFKPRSSQPLLIGSVKPNMGHGEAVSGITSIIKAALALEHQIIPPTIGIETLNPQLKLEERNIRVVMFPERWPAAAVERISVNSFGYGGANAHAILDSARMHIPQHRPSTYKDVDEPYTTMLLPFSANNKESLAKNIEAIVSSDVISNNLRDLTYTLGSHRSSLPVRGYALAYKENMESPVSTTAPKLQQSNATTLSIAFIFTGQGAQSARMGAELLDRFPVFGQTIDTLDAHLKSLPEAPTWSLKEIILESAQQSTINKASRSQPVCTAVQIGLLALLKDWNIQPKAVIGHSSGEICAAYAAGYITMEQAIATAYYRGLAVSRMIKKGAMMAVGLNHEKVHQHILRHNLQGHLRVACINSPESTTVSGESDAIDTLLSALQAQEVFVRKLKTDEKAYHSHLMQEIGQYYEDLLEPVFAKKNPVDLEKPNVKMFSSVISDLAEQELVGTPDYWRKNLESPVLFSSAMELLLSSGTYHMIEVGPHPALAQPVRDIQQGVNNTQSSYASTLSRGLNSELSMLHLAGALFLEGYKLPFSRINGIDTESTDHAFSNGIGHLTNGTDANGHATNGHATNGHATNGHATNGHATNGHATNGHVTNGHVANGNNINGHKTNGHVTNEHKSNGNGTTKTSTNGFREINAESPEDRIDEKIKSITSKSNGAHTEHSETSIETLNGNESSHDVPNGAQIKSDDIKSTHSSRHNLRVLHNLPTYAWNHQDLLWNESRISSEYRNQKYKRHDLLGSRISGTPGRGYAWRNTLKLQEVPWIQDHKLGQTIVFPAAGYLAMAIEGLCQVHDYSPNGKITLKQVHLLNLLVLEAEGDGVELNMQLEQARISNAATSDIWWRFEICSRIADVLTVHATGLIALKDTSLLTEIPYPFVDSVMEEQATRTWYNKLAKEGLCFGPEFQSLAEIKTDRGKKNPGALAKTAYRQGGSSGKYPESDYVIHPVTIDAMLQAAIVGSSAGVVHDFKGKIPVVVGELDILLGKTISAAEVCDIRATSSKVGLESVVLSGELQSNSGQTIVQMKDVRIIPYREQSLQSSTERNPYLRILWKPNISTMGSEDSGVFASYLEQFNSLLPSQVKDSNLAYLAGALDLITHKSGRTKILELSHDNNDQLEEVVVATGIGGKHKHFDSYTRATITLDGDIKTDSKKLKPDSLFDIVVVSSPISTGVLLSRLENIKQYVTRNATLVFASDSTTARSLSQKQLSLFSAIPENSNTTVTIARLNPTTLDQTTIPEQSKVIVVSLTTTLPLSPLQHAIIDELSASLKVHVELIGLEDVTNETVPPNSTVVTTVELESPILSTITTVQLEHLKILSENSSFLLWLTGGSLYKASNPEYAVILGLSRSLMLERPSLKMPVFDIDLTTPPATSARNVVSVMREVMSSGELVPDTEYRQHEGVIYHSRIVPDIVLNKEFRHLQDEEVTQILIEEAGYCKLGMKQVRNINTLRFQEVEKDGPVPRGYVEVQVRAMGINAKDLDTLTDKADVRNGTCSLEFSGVITATGSQVSVFKPGDRVVVLAPNYGGTYERVPEWACCRLNDDEEFVTMATVPMAFATALHALEDRARLEIGQSVLIHSATESVGLAAIQIAQLKGAEIFATVDTEAKKAFLVNNLHIPSSHIFQSQSVAFLDEIKKATSGNGVDVILNSLTGDLLQASWEAVADFGTFIELGKRDIVDSGLLDMRVFNSGTTFTAFDMGDIFWSKKEIRRQTIHRLLCRSIELLREEKIRPVSPLEIFPASQVVEAFRYFASSERIGKVALTFLPSDTIPIVKLKHNTRFDARKSYILVGCLGGLGRSLAQWMLKRGARNFVFMGRSGISKPAARNTVTDLQAAGADVEVVQGDVSCYADVERAVTAAKLPIGGIVQAAMSIHVALFNETTPEKWHSGISQKVQGSLNLYKALTTVHNTSQLDFFLMLSSVTGSVGVATEANYCAAGAFQDAFGAHLRSLGLPGVSLGLGMVSEVGFLHERPGTEAVLLRKGLHPLTEEEFLVLIDGAINSLKSADESGDMAWGKKHHMDGHILTGLELQGFQKHRDMGFVRGVVVLEDPRFTYMAGAFAASEPTSADADANGSNFPRAVASALARNESDSLPGEELVEAIAGVVIARIATLLLVPPTQLQITTHLADFGMESMLAAEFRSDMFRAFKVDVPFAVLMAQGTQIRNISELVGQSLLDQK